MFADESSSIACLGPSNRGMKAFGKRPNRTFLEACANTMAQLYMISVNLT